MPLYTHQSLEVLKSKIDLREVLEDYVELKPAGANLKACCPFHEEKTPSFVVGKASSHYHCFGCGAHGDAIAFIMEYLRLDFCQAIEMLAQKFQVTLEYRAHSESDKKQQGSKVRQRQIMQLATEFYMHNLLALETSRPALDYLASRGFDLDFIRTYQMGLSCKAPISLKKFLNSKRFSDKELAELGLVSQTKQGRWRDFFVDRIMFPVHDAMGNVIAFSARKYHESTQGGKYINSPETPLFKKSSLLYGLNYCRRRIVKENKVILVEGQVDALKLIDQGINFTLAALGTAFGVNHAKEIIKLGVQSATLLYDGDAAGRQAAIKVGDLLIREGVDVHVVDLGLGNDPDTYLSKYGLESLVNSVSKPMPYLNFLYHFFAGQMNISTPAGKQSLVKMISEKITSWSQPVLVHESHKKLASLSEVPLSIINKQYGSNTTVSTQSKSLNTKQNPSPYLAERELLQLLLQVGSSRKDINRFVFSSLMRECFQDKQASALFYSMQDLWNSQGSLSTLALTANLTEESLFSYFEELVSSPCPKDKWQEHVEDLVYYLMRREWFQRREYIRQELNEGACSEEKAWSLLKQFQELKKEPEKPIANWDEEDASHIEMKRSV